MFSCSWTLHTDILSTARHIFLLDCQSKLFPTAFSGVQNWTSNWSTTSLVDWVLLAIFGLSRLFLILANQGPHGLPPAWTAQPELSRVTKMDLGSSGSGATRENCQYESIDLKAFCLFNLTFRVIIFISMIFFQCYCIMLCCFIINSMKLVFPLHVHFHFMKNTNFLVLAVSVFHQI